MSNVPHIPQDLLEYLERTYPDTSPSLQADDREIWFRAGQAELVKALAIHFEEQNETILSES